MATREEYRKKYGATTLGQTGTTQTQKSISNGGVSREEYAKKYGMTTGLGQTSSDGSRRTAMQEAAEGFANSLRSQNQFRGQYTPPDWESAVNAGKQKKSVLTTPYVLDPTKDDIPTMLKGYGDELKLAKYRKNYNLSYMTDDEKNNYYYLVGKYGLESGDNYLKQINDSLKKRNAKDIEETGKKVGKTDPLTGILGNVIGSVTSGAGYLQDVADTVRGKEVDRNNPGHRMSGLENATREGLKEAARENIADSPAMDFAVDTGLSMTQSLARLPFGYAGLGIAGLSAATGAEEDALDQGVSAKKALAQGTAQGIAEGLFEKFSLGNLKNMQSVPVYSWKDVAKNIAKQMGTEASEEMLTEAANALTDRLIMGDKSQWVQDKENSSMLGAAGNLAERIGLAGLGGAVSGGLMGGGGMLVSGINQQRYGRSNALDNYQEIADSIDTDLASYKTEEDAKRAQNLESLARSYAALQARGGEPTAMQQGAFMRDYYDLIPGVKDFSEDTTPAREETASAAQNNENIQDQTDIAQKTQKQETRNAYPYNPNLTDEQIKEIIAKDFADDVVAGEQENQKVAPVQQPESRIESEETRQTVPETMENVRTERSTENVDYDTLNDYAKGLGENGRKAFVENYDGNLSIDDYQTAYGRYYDAGRYNADMDTAEKSMLASMMTPEQAVAAYKAGAQDRNLAIQTRSEYRQGEARTGSAEDLTGQASAAQKALAQSLGKKTGLRFELVDSSTASGSYEAKSGVVRLNINSKNILQTASHELTHFIQDYAPTEYGAYKQMAANVLMDRDGVTADELVRNYEARYTEAGQNLSRDQIWDEIVSDGTGLMLNDEKLIKQVTSENRTLAQKIVDFISDMIDSIKALISGDGVSKSAKYLHENIENFENIRDMWAYGIEEASEKYKSGQTIVDDPKERLLRRLQVEDADIDETKSLIAVHNVDAEKLVKTLEYDGIRFQLEDVDQNVESDREADQILKENRELREANEALKKQLTLTKDYVPRMEDIKRTANKLLRDYNSKYSKDTLIKNLSSLYNYMHSYEEGGYGQSMGEINRAAQAIARSIVQNASLKDEIGDEYKNVLKRIRSTKMVVPESYRTELDSEGGYNVFRKKYFGRLRLGNEGIDVDTAYEELSNLYPHLFHSDIINPADQILKIAQVYDDLSPQIKNPYHANMDEMTTIVANEIKEAAVNVRALPTTMADKMQAQIYRAQQEYRAKTEAYKARLKGEYDSDITEVEKNAKTRRSEINRQIHDLAEQYRSYGEGSTKEEQQQIRALKKENWRQQEELRAERKALEDKVDFDMLAGKEKYQRRRDAAESRKHREKIRKDVDEMAKWLTTPTDQKHVPESLRKPLAEFLSGIDYSSNRTNSEGEATARTNKWWDLTKQFDQIAKEGVSTDDGESLYMDVDPDLAEKMATLKDQVKDFDKLENLDLKSLRTLRDVVASMKHSIQDANKVFANNSYERVDQIAKDFLKENKERATKTIYTGARGSIDSMFRSDMLDAGTMFGRMGTAMETVYREQRDGFDRKVRDTKTAQDYMANVLEEKGIDSKELQTWTGKNAEKHTFEVQGGTINLTTAQIMSLYELNKRAAAKEHIYNKLGGIKSAPTVEYDKKNHGYVVNKSTEPVSVSALDVQKITDTLTPQQKEIADSVVKFFTTVTSQWGNEVSMDMYGYKKFNAKNYFPIVSDKNYIATKESELGSTLTTLRNMGSTKHTVPHANNPIIIEDIFDVYTRQADQMSSYHAFVRPLADLQKVLNYKELGLGSVKESIERTFGKDGLNYIKSLMIDLNGTSSSEKNFVAGLTRNMKTAAVGANLRTAIQQPTAYVRAAAEISPKYLVQGLKLHVSAAEWELCKQYAPIAQWKDWGYFDINTGRSMKSILMGPEGLKEKLVDNSMWLAGKGDEIAWKRLWMACQEETQDLHPELKKGSEEYYNQCGKRFSELIDKTQVVDSVLHRSKLMKSKDGLKQMYTSFMSEPTKTYNMLYRAIGDVAVKPTKDTKTKLGRVLAVYVANAAATSLAAAVVDAMRNDGEDKKFLEKYEDALVENLFDNLDPVGILPVVKDIESIFSGYSVERTDLSAFQELYYAVSKWKSKLSGESDLTYPALLIDTAKPISTLTGMPLGNALKDLKALTNTIIQSIGSPALNYSKNRFYRDIKNEDNVANYVALAMKQYADGNDKLGDQIIQDLKNTQIDKINERIKNKYVKILKEDERIQQAAGARLSGDYATYERIVGDLEKAGYDSEYIQKAIVGVGNAQDENTHLQSGSTYSMTDVINAIQNGKDYTRVYKKIVEEKREEAKKEGTKFNEKSVTSSLKSRLTATYKEAYVGGNQAARQKIRTTLYKVRINGKQLYSDDDFKDWIKSAKKK